jgi:hypothetical protein
MELATAGLFRARWTNEIHDEWIRNVLKNRPDLSPEPLERTRTNMNRAVMGCLVDGYQSLVGALTLPDGGDRHVLAAAIHCSADAIITANLKHFPKAELAKYEIEAQHPDEFLHHQFGLDEASMVVAAQRIRKRLKNPPKTAEEYLDALEAQQLPQTVADLRSYVTLI